MGGENPQKKSPQMDLRYRAAQVFYYAVVVAVSLWWFSFARLHPQLTVTQLLLTYWKEYLLGDILIVTAFFIFDNAGSP